MLKTLQIGLEWFPERGGGLDRVFYDCTRYLPQAGVSVRGLVVGSSEVWSHSHHQVSAFANPEAPLWVRWQGVRKSVQFLLKEQDFKLVVSHFALYTLPVLNQLGDLPLVIHFQGPWAFESKLEGGHGLSVKAKWLLEWITYRRATHFIVLSQAFKSILHEQYQVPLEKVHVVPPGVDLSRFQTSLINQASAREQLGWSQSRPIILTVRRLAHRMGLENLIEAINITRKTHPDVLLLVAGKGSLQATLKEKIETLGLENHVKLLGFVSDQDLALAYRAANFSVVPTVALEGFGLIVIESLANGTPVLATPIDSLPEILTPLSPDLLFESASAAHISEGISAALSGRRSLPSAATCQAYVDQHYTWPVISHRIRDVYDLAVKGG